MRQFALVRTRDQWSRMSFQDVVLDPEDGGVQLAIAAYASAATKPGQPTIPAGLAFDRECRLYRSLPEAGQVVRQLWSGTDVRAAGAAEQPTALFGSPLSGPTGAFSVVGPPTPPLRTPRGLAVDEDDRLYLAEAGGGDVLVYDLWSDRLLRRAGLGPEGMAGRTPLDLATDGRTVWIVTADPPALMRMTARTGPVAASLERPADVPPAAAPARIATAPAGGLFVLWRDGNDGWLAADSGGPAQHVGFASDLEFDGAGTLAVARRPNEDLLTFASSPAGWIPGTPLKGRGYDGLGIVRAPGGRIGFWSETGFREAFVDRVFYVRRGRVTTYRLDGRQFQTEWGRLFVEACIPEGTQVTVHTATADEASDEPAIARVPPADATLVVRRPDLSPPMPPISLAPGPNDVNQQLFHRDTGRELPWSRPAADDPFETFEAPITAAAGRYLWVTLELSGHTRSTPRVRALRAEHPGHDLLRRLPRTYSREQLMASFLTRYLAMFDGELHDLDARAEERQVLVDPEAAPEEVLPWLATFMGLVLDLRWPLVTRRTLLREAAWLFRFRGTVPGLKRFLEIYLGVSVAILERWRLRGLGGAMLGQEPGAGTTGSVVGAGFRVGGAVSAPNQPPTAPVADAFATNAHRFTVLVPAVLSNEQEDVVRHLLEAHRPAHTIYELCAGGGGMRIGQGLHIGLSSVVGRTGSLQELQLGSSRLGRTALVGRPELGTRPGSSRAGLDTRAG